MRGEVRYGRRDGQESLHGDGTVRQPRGQQHEDSQAGEHLGAGLEDGCTLLHEGHWGAADTCGQLDPQHVLL